MSHPADAASSRRGPPGPGDAPGAVHSLRDPRSGVEGWLIVDDRGPSLAHGSARFDVDVTEAEVRRRARDASWTLAGHGLPVGGAAAGFRADPRDPDLAAALGRFAAELEGPLRHEVVLGHDTEATGALVDGLYAAAGLAQLEPARRAHPDGAMPRRVRELEGYMPHMTGLGAAWAARTLLEGRVAGVRIAVHGFDAPGAGAARHLERLGATLVGVADGRGTLLRSAGLPAGDLVAIADATGRIDRERIDISAEEGLETGASTLVLEAEADVLVLGMGWGGVDAEGAEAIHATRVVEAASRALTDEAREVLRARGVEVVPDLVAAGAPAALVGRQLVAGNELGGEEVWEQLLAAIGSASIAAVERSGREGVPSRTAHLRSLGVDV